MVTELFFDLLIHLVQTDAQSPTQKITGHDDRGQGFGDRLTVIAD